jgi:thymidine phosphorylase
MISADSSDEEIVRFFRWVEREARADPTVAANLAEILARSGECLEGSDEMTADVASTGGPSSLSTLLCPLFLIAAGCRVPKLGVPGRPAGGIDCLAQLPTYKTSLEPTQVRAVLDKCRYAHFVGSSRFAPLDARLFRLRQQYGAQAIPTLVAASLLSKKIAVGVRRAGLDIRVAPYGNFGGSWADAEANAVMFVRAAHLRCVEAYPVLTDGQFPYQPYIGRREALIALEDIFEDSATAWLQNHLSMCRAVALACVPSAGRPSIAAASSAELRRVFESNLIAQGSSPAEFNRMNGETRAAHRTVLHARFDGFVDYSLDGIRRALVTAQMAVASEAEFPDPAGVILLKTPGSWVRRGEPVATLRLDPPATAVTVSGLEDAICRTLDRPRGLGIEGVARNE